MEVIRIIKNHNPIMKSEIAKISGLTNTTVNNFINDLMEKGIVQEEGIADSSGGRKASLYSFNPRIRYVIGMLISVKGVSTAVFDLNLNIIDRIEEYYDFSQNGVEDGLRFLTECIPAILEKSKIGRDLIIGLGISVPGPVDYEKGIVAELTNIPKWRNVPLKKVMEEKFGIPTLLDKDNNCNVLSLKWLNKTHEKNNIVYLSTFEGLGVGILFDGKVFRGNHCIAGEIGHISVDMEGEKCNCGNRGCIELYASNLAIVNQAKKSIAHGRETLIKELAGNHIEQIDIDLITKAAKADDAFAKSLFWEASKYISISISNTIKMYDPDEILLHCPWLREFHDIYDHVINQIYENTELIKRDETMITLISIDDLHLIGAATLVIEYQFRSVETSALL